MLIENNWDPSKDSSLRVFCAEKVNWKVENLLYFAVRGLFQFGNIFEEDTRFPCKRLVII